MVLLHQWYGTVTAWCVLRSDLKGGGTVRLPPHPIHPSTPTHTGYYSVTRYATTGNGEYIMESNKEGLWYDEK